jgi:hypothetical protein
VTAAEIKAAEGADLCGPFQTLFESRSLDDLLWIAETEFGAESAVLTPELLEPCVEGRQLGSRLGIVTPRQLEVELGPALARAIDLLVNLCQRHTG